MHMPVRPMLQVYVHLTDSPLYVSVLFGVVCSVALLLFHFHMASWFDFGYLFLTLKLHW